MLHPEPFLSIPYHSPKHRLPNPRTSKQINMSSTPWPMIIPILLKLHQNIQKAQQKEEYYLFGDWQWLGLHGLQHEHTFYLLVENLPSQTRTRNTDQSSCTGASNQTKLMALGGIAYQQNDATDQAIRPDIQWFILISPITTASFWCMSHS